MSKENQVALLFTTLKLRHLWTTAWQKASLSALDRRTSHSTSCTPSTFSALSPGQHYSTVLHIIFGAQNDWHSLVHGDRRDVHHAAVACDLHATSLLAASTEACHPACSIRKDIGAAS